LPLKNSTFAEISKTKIYFLAAKFVWSKLTDFAGQPVLFSKIYELRKKIDESCSDNQTKVVEVLKESAILDENEINIYIRDRLRYKAPYLAVVDDLWIGVDPFVTNVVIISVSTISVFLLIVTAYALSKSRLDLKVHYWTTRVHYTVPDALTLRFCFNVTILF